MKILIADDEKGMRELFKTVFLSEFSGSIIDMVVNGVEAVDAFRNGNYDVLWLDVSMPVKNGYEVCMEIQEICRREKLKMPFIIFCTGYRIPAEVEELIADKTHYAVLRKPATYEQIIDTFKAVK
ncbi:MAG: response regulator [Nitrospira sp.]|nr:response regulator [Nitrospira sp.]